MNNNYTVLIIDDEVQIRRMLEITLSNNHYKVHLATTAKEGIVMAANFLPDVILLDLGLPDENGHQVLTKLREWYNKPIIILSVQSSEEDIVKALDNGANDYLVKPFRTGELLARLRSVMRTANMETDSPVIASNELQIDFNNRVVSKHDQIIKLTSTEYALLSIFFKNIGKALTHQYLLKEVWGPSYVNESQYLRVFIAQLRKKIEDNPNKPTHIITESGVGYRFV